MLRDSQSDATRRRLVPLPVGLLADSRWPLPRSQGGVAPSTLQATVQPTSAGTEWRSFTRSTHDSLPRSGCCYVPRSMQHSQLRYPPPAPPVPRRMASSQPIQQSTRPAPASTAGGRVAPVQRDTKTFSQDELGRWMSQLSGQLTTLHAVLLTIADAVTAQHALTRERCQATRHASIPQPDTELTTTSRAPAAQQATRQVATTEPQRFTSQESARAAVAPAGRQLRDGGDVVLGETIVSGAASAHLSTSRGGTVGVGRTRGSKRPRDFSPCEDENETDSGGGGGGGGAARQCSPPSPAEEMDLFALWS